MPDRKVRVLIVDDSALMRQMLSQILSADPEIEVAGTAADPYIAQEKIAALKPDVLTLDVEMPRMDGLAFLEALMPTNPMPVLMVSSHTHADRAITLRALELGALDFFPKPERDPLTGLIEGSKQIIAKVKAAARANLPAARPLPAAPPAVVPPPSPIPDCSRLSRHILAIGASTGGAEAIRAVLTALPVETPGIVLVQHMPPGFTASFAERLNGLCAITVREAQDGDRVLPGHALLAPGDWHTTVLRSGEEFCVRVTAGPPVNHHRPSVDALFDSIAEQAGPHATAALLTGMGDDGARGMRRMRDAGARTIAQDEKTCAVFGMPREAIALGGAEFILPLHRIGEALRRLALEGVRC